MNVRITEDGDSGKSVRKMFQNLNDQAPSIINLIMDTVSNEIIKIAQREYLNANAGDSTRLHSRSGKLSSSVRFWRVGKYDRDIGSNLVYARIQHEGGTINPGARGFLAWRLLEGYKVSGVRGKNYRSKALYGDWIFTRRPVYIPARPYISTSIKQFTDEDGFDRTADRVLQAELKKIEGAN